MREPEKDFADDCFETDVMHILAAASPEVPDSAKRTEMNGVLSLICMYKQVLLPDKIDAGHLGSLLENAKNRTFLQCVRGERTSKKAGCEHSR